MSKTKQSNFLKAYENCHESLVRYCSVLAHGKMDTEDLVQDVLLAAYANFDKIKNKDQLLQKRLPYEKEDGRKYRCPFQKSKRGSN